MAGLGPIARVEIQVAIALGASVHPFTRITPNVSNTITSKAGFVTRLPKNSVSVTVIIHQLS